MSFRGRNNNANYNSSIKVKLDAGSWTEARNYQAEALNLFKSVNNGERPYIYDNNQVKNRIKFRIERLLDQRIYIMRENNTRMSIVDWNDVKVFLLDKNPVGWYPGRSYQTWAFFDFVYCGEQERYYASNGSTEFLPGVNYINIPVENLEPNIIFRMSRNENGTVFYEKDDAGRTRVRISDNDFERAEYLHSYQNMNNPRQNINNNNEEFSLTIFETILFDVKETLDDDEMCVVCNVNQQNIRFMPCKHTATCSVCAQELLRRSHNEQLDCPMCRQNVNTIKKFTLDESVVNQNINSSQNDDLLNDPIVNPIVNIRMNQNVNLVNWFEMAFGFKEESYENAKMRFDQMFLQNNNELNGIRIGKFYVFNANDLYQILQNAKNANNNVLNNGGKVKIENINGDVVDIHRDKNLSENATIQVASQFNCLEMITPNKNPEDGITIYSNDNTQGPKCAMVTPAGLVYRNYLYKNGQTNENQIDMLSQLLIFLKTLDPQIKWIMKNGYIIFNNDEEIKRINRILVQEPSVRRTARSLIQVGIHNNLGVFINSQKYDHIVNHVYCSGLPISSMYNPNIEDKNVWLGLSELFLEALYEDTLISACYNNIESKQNKPCYLTKVGGGVYGMNHRQIARAIKRACQIISVNGFNLEVKLVSINNNLENEYQELPKEYPLTNTSADSIWDNLDWVIKYCQ